MLGIRREWPILAAFLLCLCFFNCSSNAEGGKRVALVVGVSKYKHAPTLPNTGNDANAVSAALTQLGFVVDTLIDPDRIALENGVRRLGEGSRGAEASLFFFAGHALEVSGQNLLVPASANIQSDRDLRFETLDLESVLETASGGPKVSILMLDSCRDNPFVGKLSPGARSTRLRGLGPIDAVVGTLIAFATAPGRTADDGGGKNSPFTTALLHHIADPGVEIRRMLSDVRREVREATGGRQIPWENSALEGDFYFKPLKEVPATKQPAAQSLAPIESNEFREAFRAKLHAVLPDMSAADLEINVKGYLETKGDRAQAVVREINKAWRSGYRESPIAAEQGALEACQIYSARPCVLIAVNNQLMNAPEDGSWIGRSMSRVIYDGQFNPEQIPAIRQQRRQRNDIREYLSVSGPKAAAIHPWGKLFISTGSPDQQKAEEEALAKCNDDPERKGSEGPCYLYAIRNHVVLPLRMIRARSAAKELSEGIRLVTESRAEPLYRYARDPKALAVEPESGWWSYWDGDATIERSEQFALTQCQLATNRPCVLLAKGDSLATSDPFSAPLRDMALLHYSDNYRVDRLPIFPGASADVARAYPSLVGPKAMAIKAIPPRFVSAVGESAKQAEEKALSDCNRISGTPCLLYAVGDNVVINQRRARAEP